MKRTRHPVEQARELQEKYHVPVSWVTTQDGEKIFLVDFALEADTLELARRFARECAKENALVERLTGAK